MEENSMSALLCAICKHHPAKLQCDACGMYVCTDGASEHHGIEAHGKGNYEHSSFSFIGEKDPKLKLYFA